MPSYKLKTVTGQTVIHHPYPAGAQRPPITNCIRIVTIDPGTKNISLSAGYKMSGAQPVILKLELCDITTSTQPQVDECFGNLTRWLMQFREFFRESHYIIIERQRDENYMAIRVAQHVLSFIMTVVIDSPVMPTLVELDSKVKTKTCPQGANKRQYKRWSTIQFIMHLVMARDGQTLQYLSLQKKLDDLADVWTQAHSFMAQCAVMWYQPRILPYPVSTAFDLWLSLADLQHPSNTLKEIVTYAISCVAQQL